MQNLLKSREEILAKRAEILAKKPQAFKGNTKERTMYLAELKRLKPDLTPFQKEYLVGLNLGDGSVDLNDNAKTARLKIQQSERNKAWLASIKEIFLEYMGNDEPIPQVSGRPTMLEIQTLKSDVFYNFLQPIFYKDLGQKRKKTINKDKIKPYITPVCVAAWFCGDGSKADHTKNKGKGISLHSQGFTQAENVDLAECLRSNIGLICSEKLDNPVTNQYRIDVSGESFELFVEKVGPYIHEAFHRRVPEGRVADSRFGYMNDATLKTILGKKLVKDIVCTYVKT